jgi:RNA polymerase sigma-70 factor (ECF subfamily)
MNDIDDPTRRQLLGIAYRMLGSHHDAEDAVHTALLRWHQLDADERSLIREPAAWLTRVVSRICIDELRSARHRREQYRGIWLPEPLIDPSQPGGADPAERLTLDESVSYAFLVAMERLTPAERVSFILHDVFALPFDEIAETVGRTPAACRQLASSARRHLAAERRYDPPGADRDRTVQAFLDACRGADLEQLVKVLDPDVSSQADGGRAVRAAVRPVHGASNVARYLLSVRSRQRLRMADGPVWSMGMVNGRSGILIRNGDHVVGTIDLAVAGGAVARIAIQVNPDKVDAFR